MKIAGLVQDSIVDGPGLRFAVYTQGCDFKCDNCHNPVTWDPDGGTEISTDELIKQMCSNPLTDGLSLSGGEPLMQTEECIRLAAAAREKGLNVWLFTGYDFDEIMILIASKPNVKELIELTDVLIDGRYIHSKRSLALRWRGSSNQRVLDTAKSLEKGQAVELEM